MPFLNIDLNNIKDSYRNIEAAMRYPSDSESRDYYISFFRDNNFLKSTINENLKIDKETEESIRKIMLKVLVLSAHKYSLRESVKVMRNGMIAGGILAFMKQLHDHDYKASRGKIRYVFERCDVAKKMIYAYNEISLSKSTIDKAWEEYKCVSHLYAVSYLYKWKVLSRRGYRKHTLESLLQYLAFAEWFRHFGETYNPGYGAASTLKAEEMWAVPKEINLPDVQISLPPPSSWLIDALKKYKAPTANHPARD